MIQPRRLVRESTYSHPEIGTDYHDGTLGVVDTPGVVSVLVWSSIVVDDGGYVAEGTKLCIGRSLRDLKREAHRDEDDVEKFTSAISVAEAFRQARGEMLEPLPDRSSNVDRFMLAFINMSYTMMTTLLVTVPTLEDVCIECLGDIARYGWPISHSDERERRQWCGIARY